MLCFLPSRSVTDVVRDSFYWFTVNHRAFRLYLWLVTAVSAFVAVLFSQNMPRDLMSAFTADMLDFVVPYSYISPRSNDTEVTMGYCILTFVSTMLIVPLIRRYFLEKRSLARLTYARYAAIVGQHIRSALVAALVCTAVCCLVIVAAWYVGIAFVLLGSLLLALDFCGWSGFRVIRHYAFYLRCSLTGMLLFCLIQGAPMLCSELAGLALYFLDDLLPNVLSADSGSWIVDYAVSAMMCLAYCLAVAYYNLISILTYGSSVDTE